MLLLCLKDYYGLLQIYALGKERTVSVARLIVMYKFICHCQFASSHCPLRFSAGPAQGMTSYRLDPLGNPQQIVTVMKSANGSFNCVYVGSGKFESVIVPHKNI
jgi:hypothetical protein